MSAAKYTPNADDYEAWLARAIPELRPAIRSHGFGAVVKSGRYLKLRFILREYAVRLTIVLPRRWQFEPPRRRDARYRSNAERQMAYRARRAKATGANP